MPSFDVTFDHNFYYSLYVLGCIIIIFLVWKGFSLATMKYVSPNFQLTHFKISLSSIVAI